MVKGDGSGPRGPGFDSHESLKTYLCFFDGCHDKCTNKMSDLKWTAKL